MVRESRPFDGRVNTLGAAKLTLTRERLGPPFRGPSLSLRIDFVESDGFVSALLDEPGVRPTAEPLGCTERSRGHPSCRRMSGKPDMLLDAVDTNGAITVTCENLRI